MYFGSDGGIYSSTDAGLTWTSLNNTSFRATQFQSLALHPTDREFMIGGTQDNGTELKRPDGTWTRADFGDGGYAIIDQNAADTTNVTMYHTYFNQTTAKGFGKVTTWRTPPTTAGRASAAASAASSRTASPAAAGTRRCSTRRSRAARATPNTLYFGSDRVWRSADGGTTMPAVSQVLVAGQPITTIAVSPVERRLPHRRHAQRPRLHEQHRAAPPP